MAPPLKKILYVEDELDIQVIARISLEDLGGFEVKFCNNGFEAIKEAEAFKPDLILLDVMMPDLDGPETLKALRKFPGIKNVPAIFLTARVQNKELEEYKKLGIINIISKPFDPMTLPDTIRQHWKAHYG